MNYQFLTFDPFNDARFPGPQFPVFVLAASNARKLLKGRTVEQLHAACDLISWMHVNPEFKAPGFHPRTYAEDEMDMITPWDGVKLRGAPTPNDLEVYFRNIDNVDLEGYPPLPDAKWFELFAVLALLFIDQALQIQLHPMAGIKGVNERQMSELEVQRRIGECACLCSEAIGMAQALAREGRVINETAETIKEEQATKTKVQNQAAAIKRHSKTRALMVELYEFYLLKPEDSYRNTARRFLEVVDKAKLSHLMRDNWLDTLSEGLSKYVRALPNPE